MKFIGMTVDIERQGNNSPSRALCWDRWDKRSNHAGFKVRLKGRDTPETGETVGPSAAANPDKVKRFDGLTFEPCHPAAGPAVHGLRPGLAGAL